MRAVQANLNSVPENLVTEVLAMSELRQVATRAVRQSHDGLFKGVMGDVAVGLVPTKLLMDPAWFEQIDLETFEQVPGSFVDIELRQKHTDMLYRGTLRDQPGRVVYVLFEHLSSRRRDVVERLYEYFAQISRFHGRSDPDGMRPVEIFGFVIYANPSRWNLAVFDNERVFRSVRVVDARWLYDQLRNDRTLPSIAVRLALMLLVYSRTPQLLRRIEENAEGFRALVSNPHYRLHHFTLHLLYIQKTTEADMAEAAIDKLEGLIPETKKVRRTLFEVQVEQGREEGLRIGLKEGREQGIEQGIEQGTAAALRNGIRTVLVARGLAPSPSHDEALEACSDADLLNLWLGRAAVATSVDEVLK